MTKKKTGISRRDFLKTGATLGAGAILAPTYLAMPSRLPKTELLSITRALLIRCIPTDTAPARFTVTGSISWSRWLNTITNAKTMSAFSLSHGSTRASGGCFA